MFISYVLVISMCLIDDLSKQSCHFYGLVTSLSIDECRASSEALNKGYSIKDYEVLNKVKFSIPASYKIASSHCVQEDQE